MAVKKLMITILAFLYLGLASGVIMNLHYCMGELSSVEYGYDNHEGCGKCGMKETVGCCSTESKVVKLQDSHQWSKLESLTKKIFEPASFTVLENLPATLASQHFGSVDYHSPPDWRANLLYLHTGVLRI